MRMSPLVGVIAWAALDTARRRAANANFQSTDKPKRSMHGAHASLNTRRALPSKNSRLWGSPIDMASSAATSAGAYCTGNPWHELLEHAYVVTVMIGEKASDMIRGDRRRPMDQRRPKPSRLSAS